MSYRTFKKLLGETSLERKCRLLFGVTLLFLITGSFYFYAALNQRIFNTQNRHRGQLLTAQNLQTMHWEKMADPEIVPFVKGLASWLKPADLKEYSWKFILVDTDDPTRRGGGVLFENDAINRLLFQNETYAVHEDTKGRLYHFFEKVVAKQECMTCHKSQNIPPLVENAGDVMAIAQTTFNLDEMHSSIAKNNAVLIVMAMITTCLAMLVAYAIVRYVIVKPVIHLKDVSDAIARGELDQRADIRTGDEFQELSHAFNRMLRHLVTTQEELRHLNTDLDGKVDELARANLSLHEMNKIKNEFLATMSHELRTPLNSILGFSDVLSSAENLTDKQKKYMLNIRTSGQNLLTLINDILDLAKIEAGRMELNVIDFTIDDLIERITLSMRPLAEKKNIDMQSSVDPTLPVIVQDIGKLQQIIYNLLSNAIKFTPEGGRIRVEAHNCGNNLFEVVVADSGIGIPLEDQAVIFEKFRQGQNQRGTNTLTREYEGTGLGLSIVKELSKLLGGEVLLESEFGKGSTFIVRLPIELLCKNKLFEAANTPSQTGSDLLRQANSFGVAHQ
ncbi:sensor histidine kinase [Planctomicrobium sp. SH668]|uniref:sensor histidine kinase n=1 Tax=Planctomicrobium sp. SH668 TaxID=3448126 RepID=UPI003F5B374E